MSCRRTPKSRRQCPAGKSAGGASVKSWYDTLYAPVVTVVENSGVLEHFPGRTAADLYLWVMDHLHYLRGHPGQEGLDPVSAAKDFVEGIEEERHDERDDPS